MMTDPIADMLTRIRNAQRARSRQVEIPFSKLKMAIISILQKEGYVGDAEKVGDTHPLIVVNLKYTGKEPAIQSITRESTPGHRAYLKAEELPRVLNDYGIAVVSTSRGLMTNKEARKLGIGGELICSVY
jgi:small subunit ribosomal protein S8